VGSVVARSTLVSRARTTNSAASAPPATMSQTMPPQMPVKMSRTTAIAITTAQRR
jgi:hypothetical protein